MWSFDVAFPEFGAEALEQLDLRVGELDLLALDVSLQSEEALMFGEQIVSFPDSANASCGDVDLPEGELLGHAEATVGGELQNVLQDGVFGGFGDAVWVRIARPRESIEKTFGAVGLEIATNLVELLPGVSHDFAGFGNVVEILGEFEETEFATSDFDFSGHVWFWVCVFVVKTTYQIHVAAVSLKTAPLSGEY